MSMAREQKDSLQASTSPSDYFNLSGAAQNHTRSKSQRPTSRASRTDMNDARNQVPHIDLYNFDDAEFEDCRYVLTSPRSLDACSRLGIKPLDLVYTHFNVFEREYPGRPLREIYKLFDETEARRKENVRRARIEREKVVDENLHGAKLLPNGRTDSMQGGLAGSVKSSGKSPKMHRRPHSSMDPPKRRPISGPPTRNLSPTSFTDEETRPDKDSRHRISRSTVPSNGKKRAADQSERERARRLRELEASEQRRTAVLDQQRKELQKLEERWHKSVELSRPALRYDQPSNADEEIVETRRLLDDTRQKLATELEASRYRRQQQQRSRPTSVTRHSGSPPLSATDRERLAREERIRQEIANQEARMGENRLKEAEFWRRRMELERMQRDETDELRKSLETRYTTVESNKERINQERYELLHNLQQERDRRLHLTQERRRQLEGEIEAYRRELQEYRHQNLERAQEKVNERYWREQARLQQERKQKEMQRMENVRVLADSEADWRRDAEELIRRKEERAERALAEKEARIRESRAIAFEAEQLREEIRQMYDRDSFDKKVQQVELVNQMGLGYSRLPRY